jgi:type IV pilus assembly protein PilW
MRSLLSSTGRRLHAATAQRGLSVVELMISIAVGLVVVGAMTTLFVNSSNNRRSLDRSADILENGHYALDLLKKELSLAGYYGTMSIPPAGATTDEPCSVNVNAETTPPTAWDSSFLIHAHGSNQSETAALPSSLPCIDGLRKANTDAIFIQRASTCVAGFPAEPGCQALAGNTAYLQVSECGDEYNATPFVLAITPDSPPTSSAAPGAYTLKKRLDGSLDCGTTGTAPIRKLYRSIYYIGTDNGGGGSDSRLWRMDLGAASAANPGGTFTFTQLADGIDNMQLEYGIDDNGDGSPDRYSSTPAAADWPNAVGARLSLLVRAGNTTAGYQDAKTYYLGDICSLPAGSACPADPLGTSPTAVARGTAEQSYRRRVFTSYVAFNTPLGRRQR